MELFSVHILKKKNSYFVFLIKMFLPLIKKIDTYNDKLFFYTGVTLIKHFTFRFRLRSIKYLKTLTKVSWPIKLIKSFIVMAIDSAYIPIKWDLCETIEDAEDRLGTTFNGEEFK